MCVRSYNKNSNLLLFFCLSNIICCIFSRPLLFSFFSRLKRAASIDTASVFSTDEDTIPYIYGKQFDEQDDFLASNEVEQEEEEEEEDDEEEEEEEG